MDLRETEGKVVDEMHLAEDKGECQAFVNVAMNLRFP
jgi:hypothetical protein